MPHFPSDLPFWSLLQYAVRGSTESSRRSRDVLHAIKTDGLVGRSRIIALGAQRVRQDIDSGGPLTACFADDPILVPMPRSAPLVSGGLWPAAAICQALVREGVAHAICPLIRRNAAIRKSSVAAPGERPNPQEHYASFALAADLSLVRIERAVLVDDVITRGSTMLGAWAFVRSQLGTVPIHCFAMMRAISHGDIERILAPVEGSISARAGRLHRDP